MGERITYSAYWKTADHNQLVPLPSILLIWSVSSQSWWRSRMPILSLPDHRLLQTGWCGVSKERYYNTVRGCQNILLVKAGPWRNRVLVTSFAVPRLPLHTYLHTTLQQVNRSIRARVQVWKLERCAGLTQPLTCSPVCFHDSLIDMRACVHALTRVSRRRMRFIILSCCSIKPSGVSLSLTSWLMITLWTFSGQVQKPLWDNSFARYQLFYTLAVTILEFLW